MGGVFMFKFVKGMILAAVLAGMLGIGTVIADKQLLKEHVLRLHVVGASDSQEDQALKLQVKDAIVTYLQPVVSSLQNTEQARSYLESNLETLEKVANSVLERAGSKDRAVATLDWETFTRRVYDTFQLPAGVFNALRIRIGEAEGKNWWCVVFPTLCVPVTAEGFEETAAAAGFPDSLTGALEGDCQIRFFLLDCLGRVENFLFDLG